jgi:hypothetical protein
MVWSLKSDGTFWLSDISREGIMRWGPHVISYNVSKFRGAFAQLGERIATFLYRFHASSKCCTTNGVLELHLLLM